MTNNKQQTAVEWYAIEMAEYLRSIYGDGIINLDILKQAKEMEKERIIDAHYEGQCNQTEGYPLQIAEQYYNETYGGNNEQH